MSVMHELLFGTKPLRGRVVLDMRLGPFDHRQAAELWGIEDPEIAFRLHAVLGGGPGYHRLVQDAPPGGVPGFGAWVVDNLFDIDLGLFTRNETEFLLREDPASPTGSSTTRSSRQRRRVPRHRRRSAG